MAKRHKIKLRPNTQQILFTLLVLIILFEGAALYYALYYPVKTGSRAEGQASEGEPAVKLDLGKYNKIKSWLDQNQSFEPPDYSLRTVTGTASTTIFSGRENPFEEP